MNDGHTLPQTDRPSSWPIQDPRPTRSGRRAVSILVCALLLAPVACTTPDPAPPPSAPPVQDYIVGAPDSLLITILPEPEIVREARVRPDGMISIDLIGDVLAAGRTPRQISAKIQEEIGRFKRDAAVNVMVVSSPSQFVTIYGEVARPGTFPLETETRASEAIGQVGGVRPFASENSIRVIRTTGTATEVIRVRLGDIQRGNLSTNIVIREGDLIVVPPTTLARIGYAFQMLLFPFQPLISGASAAGSIASGASTIRAVSN